MFVAIPYVQGMSKALRRILFMYEIRVVFKPVLTLRHLLLAPNDPIPMLDRPNVVYRIPCKKCRAAYKGMTTRPLKKTSPRTSEGIEA